jgi:hypothetical protein
MRRSTARDSRPGLAIGTLQGAAAGLVGSYAMTLFLRLLERLGIDAYAGHPQHSLRRGDPESTAENQPDSGQDDAAVEGVERLARAAGFQLTPRQKELAAPLAHYLFGTSVGALYGALAARRPGVTAACGVAFGELVWLVADFGAIPALRLSPPPHHTPWQVHARGIAAHVAYGGVMELTRRALGGRQRGD